jgi:hypothetical protein
MIGRHYEVEFFGVVVFEAHCPWLILVTLDY